MGIIHGSHVYWSASRTRISTERSRKRTSIFGMHSLGEVVRELNPKISLQKICKGFYLFLRLSIKMCNFWSIMSVAFVRSLNYRRHICFRFFGTRIVSSLIARIANSTYSCGPLNVLCQITCTGNPEMCTVKI